jgi:hypothetical protein
MTNSSSRRPGVGIREFRSGIAVYLLLFLMLFSVALLLNAKTQDKDIRWMTSEEAFDPSHNGNGPDPDAIKKVVIDAPYEEVFHAASVAVTQAMWEIDKQDKTAGVLLAHRIADEPFSKLFSGEQMQDWRYTTPKKHLYFYRVKTNELSAKQTEVVLEGKVQGYCDLVCTSLLGMDKKFCRDYKENCRELRMGIWLKAIDQPEMSQFVVLLRNNLIAAGGL